MSPACSPCRSDVHDVRKPVCWFAGGVALVCWAAKADATSPLVHDLAGSVRAWARNEVTPDGKCSFVHFECLGACEQAPMMMVTICPS